MNSSGKSFLVVSEWCEMIKSGNLIVQWGAPVV